MHRHGGLIPARFLILSVHFVICHQLLWVPHGFNVCLAEPRPRYDPNKLPHLTEFVNGLIVASVLMLVELTTFLCGLTMFNPTSALLSITCHASASIATVHFIIQEWRCFWFWFIFTWGSIVPVLYDTVSVTRLLWRRECLTITVFFYFLKDISVEQPGWTKILVLAGLVTVLGSSTPVGYNIGVINTPGWVIRQFCNESVSTRFNSTLNSSELHILWSSIVSIFLIGGCAGSLSGSLLADKIGRKGGLAVSSILGVISGITFWASKGANSVEMLLIGRVFGGLSAGLITAIMPMYLLELAPSALKGAVGALCPLGVTLGILIGQILSMNKLLGNEEWWPYCLALPAILQVVCALIIPILPESPKYLFVIKKRPHEALKQLKRLRNANEESLTDDIEMLRLEDQENKKQGDTWNIKKVLQSEALTLPLLLVCALQAGQQLSGVNAVFYYSSQIFTGAGLSQSSGELATIGTGCCNIFMAIMSVQTMSWFKRRTILQISLITSIAFLVILGLSISLIDKFSWMPYLCIVAVLGYVLCYGLALGPIPYFIGSELFEVGPRSSAMALGGMAHWAGNFLVGQTFPIMTTHIGAASFFIFAALTVCLFIFIKLYLPETKGQNPCQISHLVEKGFRSKPLATVIPLADNNHEMRNLTEKTYL